MVNARGLRESSFPAVSEEGLTGTGLLTGNLNRRLTVSGELAWGGHLGKAMVLARRLAMSHCVSGLLGVTVRSKHGGDDTSLFGRRPAFPGSVLSLTISSVELAKCWEQGRDAFGSWGSLTSPRRNSSAASPLSFPGRDALWLTSDSVPFI